MTCSEETDGHAATSEDRNYKARTWPPKNCRKARKPAMAGSKVMG